MKSIRKRMFGEPQGWEQMDSHNLVCQNNYRCKTKPFSPCSTVVEKTRTTNEAKSSSTSPFTKNPIFIGSSQAGLCGSLLKLIGLSLKKAPASDSVELGVAIFESANPPAEVVGPLCSSDKGIRWD